MSKISIADSKPSNNPWIDGLIDGGYWTAASKPLELTFSLIDSQGIAGESPTRFKSYSWNGSEKKIVELAFSNIESVANILFRDAGTNNTENAQLKIHLTGSNTMGSSRGGFGYAPHKKVEDSGMIGINRDWYLPPNGEQRFQPLAGGIYGYTFLHEICHALGLKHPHEKVNGFPTFPGIKKGGYIGSHKGDFEQNAPPYTQMTYVTDVGGEEYENAPRKREYGYLENPGALDIATLQWLYGANTEHESKDNIYDLPVKTKRGTGWSTIWDTGGIDSIEGRNAKSSVTIDLRNANLGNNGRAGGSISSINGVMGGFTIAHDWDGKTVQQKPGLCMIENAVGGPKNDVIRGNYADNELVGGDGNDHINGGNGNDTLIGGRGKDVLKGGPGRDQFVLSKDMVDEIEDFSFEDGDTITFKDSILKNQNDLQIIGKLSEGKPSKEFTFVSNTGELYTSLNDLKNPSRNDTPQLIAILNTSPF